MPLFWTSGFGLWVSKLEWAALFVIGVCATHSLRFTSGVTPGDHWKPAWQLSHSLLCMCKQALVGLEIGTYDVAHSQCETRQADALLIRSKLCQLGSLQCTHNGGANPRVNPI